MAPSARAPFDTCKVTDLGTLQGPALVFGGAYSNLQALDALLAVAKESGIPSTNVIHTGDVVAYCAHPLETTELLRASGVHCLLGNCEESIGASKTDCGCGFPEASQCNEYSVNWYAHVTEEIKDHPHLREWMRTMPERIEFAMCGRRFAVVHGSPRNISEFVWPSSSDTELAAMFAALPVNIDGIIAGHSGIPFVRFVPKSTTDPSTRLWLNAGVIGMPANDGTTRGWFAILTPASSGDLEISIRPLFYKAAEAAEAILARPQLVRGYADALLSGIWPSHDVLPLEEQMATGVHLKEKTVIWTRGIAAKPDLFSDRGTVAAIVGASAVAVAIAFIMSSRWQPPRNVS